MVALINDRRLQRGLAPLGFLNPALYQLQKQGFGDAFYDVSGAGNGSWRAVLGAEGTLCVLKCWAEAWRVPVHGAGKAMLAPRGGLGAEQTVLGLCSQSCAWGRASNILLGGRRESLWPSHRRGV